MQTQAACSQAVVHSTQAAEALNTANMSDQAQETTSVQDFAAEPPQHAKQQALDSVDPCNDDAGPLDVQVWHPNKTSLSQCISVCIA